MLGFFRALFSSDLFMPHGHCYLWKPGLVWLHVVSDGLIWLSYVAISATLAYLVSRVRDIPFKWMYFAFGIFIVSCGFTHFMEVWTVWRPVYWFAGALKAVTAIASVGTAILLPPLVPQAVALALGARAAREKGVKLETAYQQLGGLYEKTLELERLKTQFFANVSHELRTPLALVIGPAETLLESPRLDERERREIEVVLRNARVLLKRVNDLLDTSRLEAGKLEPRYESVDLASLIRLGASHFEVAAEEKKIAFSVETPDRLAAEADPEQFERVLFNLLSNALKFTPEGGRIRCTLRAPGASGRAVLEVADSGPGIPPEDRERVFERFRQLDGSATRRIGGAGLGLAIVRDLVDLHRGAVRAESAPEGGALFVVEWPTSAPGGASVAASPKRSLEEVARAAMPSLAEVLRRPFSAPPEPAATAASAPKALVIEDDPDMNRFVCETFAGEFRVVSAADGEDGYAKALSEAPDLIVTDVMMPGISGEELLQRLRRVESLGDVPVMLLTAKSDERLKARLLGEGAQDYVVKPFSREELRARARNLVRVKRAHEILQREIEVRIADVEKLALEVAQRKRELHTALESMRVAREQAESASAAKTTFLGLVSHELRTPLTTLQLQLDRLRHGPEPVPEKNRRALEGMASAATRLIDMVESLLHYTRIQSGKLTVNVQSVDVAEIARDAASELEPRAETRGIALELSIAPELPVLATDPELFRLILMNLGVNALKFTDRGGSVQIALEASDGRHRLSVRDSGIGIAEADCARIFEPFEQLDPARQNQLPGVGLGLAITRQMVEALGGTITVESAPGRGSVFTVALPQRS